MIKDKKLKETAEGKDELDLYLNNEEWAYRRLEKIVNDGIAKKWSKRAITFGVAREIYNLKDAFGRLPTTRQERLEIANDFVEALLPDDYMEESLKEDIDTVVPEKDGAPVLSASTLPVANKLIEAINGEWDTIVLYNNIITELKENNFDDIIPVIQDIVKEENTHVGQLQKALSTISPDTNDIASGEVEAEGQLNESLEECDDCEYSDDFDTDDEHELYRTDSREIPYGKDQKRFRDRQLVNRDGEPTYHPIREEEECQCVDIENEDRVNEREIRMALEDGTLTKDDIVEYTLRHTPDEMLSGMLNMKSEEIDPYDNGYDSVAYNSVDDFSDDLPDTEVGCCVGELYTKPDDVDDVDIEDKDLEMDADIKTDEAISPATIMAGVNLQSAGRNMMKDIVKKVLPEDTDEHVDGCSCQEDDLDENAVNMI